MNFPYSFVIVQNLIWGVLVPKVGCHNPKFPALKASVGIAFSKEQGRYAVALRDITAGELLAVEAAEVCTLNLEQRGENCTNCLARVPDYLPSPVTKTVGCIPVSSAFISGT